jgi:methyltransferase (TIGR00027 family)
VGQPQPYGVPTGVGLNAIGAAAVRAAESRRAGRLFTDPPAEAFVAAAGRPWRFPAKDEAAAATFWTALVAALVVRTRFFDEYLAGALAAGVRQVVMLGAGMDTRAYRLCWPRSARLWEVDLPAVLAFKDQVLTALAAVPSCQRFTVRADLREDWVPLLRAAGFRDDQPSVWLAEGLLLYLTPAQNDRLLVHIGRMAAPGSRLALSVSSHSMLESQADHEALDALGDYSSRVGTLWRSGFAEEPGSWLAGRGWRSRAYDPAERAKTYGRPLADLSEPGVDTRMGWLVSADRI